MAADVVEKIAHRRNIPKILGLGFSRGKKKK